MDPAIFRKGDASSVLVIDKSWNDIIDKPDFFDELAERIVKMSDAAESIGIMLKSTAFKQFKEAINEILMNPLLSSVEHDGHNVVQKPGTVLADALWDEIEKPDAVWAKLRDAIAKAYGMKEKIDERSPLTSSDTLLQAKTTFNDTIVKPLLGINDDE